jgi:hypothetical protein
VNLLTVSTGAAMLVLRAALSKFELMSAKPETLYSMTVRQSAGAVTISYRLNGVLALLSL